MSRKSLSFALALGFAIGVGLTACNPTALGGSSDRQPAPVSPTLTNTAPIEPPTPPEPTHTPAPTATAIPEPIVLTDGLGKTITLDGPARRVISLAPSTTEILFAVGAGAQVIGRDTFSDYPSEVQEVADIGGGFGELDLETILALEPDLVLAADIIAPEQIQGLEDLGLTVFSIPNPLTMSEMYEVLRMAAELTGHVQEADQLVASLSARVTAVEEKIGSVEDRPLVFYELDGSDPNAPWTSGPGTFIDTMIEMAGGENVGRVLEGAWAQISIEELVTQNPDFILLGDFTWGGVTPEDVAARAGWDGIAAVQNGRVFTFDDNLVSRPGPRLVDGLEAMAAILHPELFK